MIDLYTAPTPNGWKASIALEELGLPYEVKLVNILAGEQKRPEYLAINPNGRIPTLVDRDEGDFAVFESGAILIYLAEKTGKLLPTDRKGRSEVIQWVMFQMAGIGPMQGQANVFYRYFEEKIPKVIARYQNETKRLYTVLDTRLKAPFRGDANDVLYQWDSSRDYNPAPQLERIQAHVLAINSADDERNPPSLGVMERELKRVKHARLYLVPASEQTAGHGTTGQAKWWAQELAAFLATVPRPAR